MKEYQFLLIHLKKTRKSILNLFYKMKLHNVYSNPYCLELLPKRDTITQLMAHIYSFRKYGVDIIISPNIVIVRVVLLFIKQ